MLEHTRRRRAAWSAAYSSDAPGATDKIDGESASPVKDADDYPNLRVRYQVMMQLHAQGDGAKHLEQGTAGKLVGNLVSSLLEGELHMEPQALGAHLSAVGAEAITRETRRRRGSAKAERTERMSHEGAGLISMPGGSLPASSSPGLTLPSLREGVEAYSHVTDSAKRLVMESAASFQATYRSVFHPERAAAARTDALGRARRKAHGTCRCPNVLLVVSSLYAQQIGGWSRVIRVM